MAGYFELLPRWSGYSLTADAEAPGARAGCFGEIGSSRAGEAYGRIRAAKAASRALRDPGGTIWLSPSRRSFAPALPGRRFWALIIARAVSNSERPVAAGGAKVTSPRG